MPNFEWENSLRKDGYQRIAGIDEVGRGPLAGPVLAAAVILPESFVGQGLNDSKKLTEKRREQIYLQLTEDPSVAWNVAEASVEEIETLNILGATHLAMRRALAGLNGKVDAALIDGLPLKDFPIPHRGVVKGDSQSLSIAAASVIAKVSRDRLMENLADIYPQYGFEKHKGYGTKYHLSQLALHGPCPIHRQAFRPVADLTGHSEPENR